MEPARRQALGLAPQPAHSNRPRQRRSLRDRAVLWILSKLDSLHLV